MNENLSLNLVRVTEMAAISANMFLGRGNKNAADQAAVDGMHEMFRQLDINCTVVIGEGEVDEAPMLYIGENIGSHKKVEKIDIAVDPIDGTKLIANGLPGAIAVIAAAPEGCLLHAPDMYMEKIIAGPEAVGKLSIDYSVKKNIELLAKAKGKSVKDIVVSIQNRPRHDKLKKEVIEAGARVISFEEGDVANSIPCCFSDSEIDMLIGKGGAAEGVVTAVAIKGLGGFFEGRLKPVNKEQEDRCKEMGIKDINKVLHIEDLVKGDDAIFAATGITKGEFLDGIRSKENNVVETQSICIRVKTGTVRYINATHNLNKKIKFENNKMLLK